MDIMVFNVPAETVGALSILNEFYEEVKKSNDKNINWIFVLSKPKLKETSNIKVIRFPWIKKSWIHRFYFDNFIAPRLIKKFKVDKVLSFQNVIIPHTKIKQMLYMHNSLPFVDYKFSFRENRHLWIYQNIIGRTIINSIKKANKVFVQTEWIKKACIKKAGIPNKKIDVISPQLNINIEDFFQPNKDCLRTFFYPASGFFYKNHKAIIDACKKLKERDIKDYKVIFTLDRTESDYAIDLYNKVEEMKLPIEFIGSLSREEVFEFYTKSVLLFPSYIETYGLPMLEAKLHKGMILASDCSFSHEILDGYKNVYYFDPFNPDELAYTMENLLSNNISYLDVRGEISQSNSNGWSELLNQLVQGGD